MLARDTRQASALGLEGGGAPLENCSARPLLSGSLLICSISKPRPTSPVPLWGFRGLLKTEVAPWLLESPWKFPGTWHCLGHAGGFRLRKGRSAHCESGCGARVSATKASLSRDCFYVSPRAHARSSTVPSACGTPRSRGQPSFLQHSIEPWTPFTTGGAPFSMSGASPALFDHLGVKSGGNVTAVGPRLGRPAPASKAGWHHMSTTEEAGEPW